MLEEDVGLEDLLFFSDGRNNRNFSNNENNPIEWENVIMAERERLLE